MAHAYGAQVARLRSTSRSIAPANQGLNLPRSDPFANSISNSQKSPSSGKNIVSQYARGDHYKPRIPSNLNETTQSAYSGASRRRSRSPVRSTDSSGGRSRYSGSSRRRSRSPLRSLASRTSRHEHESSTPGYADEHDRGRRSRSPTIYRNDKKCRIQPDFTTGARDIGGHDRLNYDGNGSPNTLLNRSRNADSVSNYSSKYPNQYADNSVRRLAKYGDDDDSDCRSSVRGSRPAYVTMLQSSPFDNHQFAKSEYAPGVIILAPLHEEDFNRTPRPSYQESLSSYRSGHKSHVSHTDFGAVYSEMRLHIVVETYGSRYEAIPLYTHKGNGLLHKDNRNEYASIVDHRYPKMSEREAPHTLVTGTDMPSESRLRGNQIW